VFEPLARPVAEVIAVAKTDLPAGTAISGAIGGDYVYGEIEERGAAAGAVPICLLEQDERHEARTRRAVARGEPVLWSDIELPESDLLAAWRRQEQLLAEAARRKDRPCDSRTEAAGLEE
jgi:predicted homoserine dehydrogenase-like protein